MVYQQTLAKKILFSADKVATGVRIETAGIQYTLSARKEVILAAGAVCFPARMCRDKELTASSFDLLKCLWFLALVQQLLS